MTYTIRFNYPRGRFLVCVDAATDVHALSMAKKELGDALGSRGALSRVSSVEIFKGARDGLEPRNT